MSECLWCYEPADGQLCASCREIHDAPLFHCERPNHITPTLGTECAACAWERNRQQRIQERNAPLIAELKEIREQLITDWRDRWPGFEFGKVLLGNAINAAIDELEQPAR